MQKIILLGGDLNGTVMHVAKATPYLKVPLKNPVGNLAYPGANLAPAMVAEKMVDYQLCGLESPTGAKIYQMQGMTSEAVVACLILAIESKDEEIAVNKKIVESLGAGVIH